MRYLWLAVLLLASAYLATPSKAEWPLDKMNEQIEKTNVVVGGVCSGTIVDIPERLVLTAHHCITGQLVEEEVKEIDDKTGEVRTKKVQKRKPLQITVNKIVNYEIVSSVDYLVSIKGIDASNDIALLQVMDPDYKPAMAARLAPDDFKYQRGVRVYAIGNPGVTYDNSITEGIISAPMRKVDFGGGSVFNLFQHSAATIGGGSGGSIVNDRGELIGTVTGGLRGTAVSFAIPISATKELLRKSGFAKVLEAK
jgi:S1-C subfamily serine protease